MSWGAGLVASLLVILPRPAAWIVGLAVPGPWRHPPVPAANRRAALAGRPGEHPRPNRDHVLARRHVLGFATLVTAIAAFFMWLIVGGWVAAVTERDLIELVVADEEPGGRLDPDPRRAPRGRIWRIVLLRLAAHVRRWRSRSGMDRCGWSRQPTAS